MLSTMSRQCAALQQLNADAVSCGVIQWKHACKVFFGWLAAHEELLFD